MTHLELERISHAFGPTPVLREVSLAVEGATPKMLPAGSYFSLAGGVKHVTAVEGDAPCVFYIEREGAFDAIMAEPASAPKK